MGDFRPVNITATLTHWDVRCCLSRSHRSRPSSRAPGSAPRPVTAGKVKFSTISRRMAVALIALAAQRAWTAYVEVASMPTELPVIAQPRMDLVAPDVARRPGGRRPPADRVRASILAMLADGPHCVCEMAAALGRA